MQNLTSTLKNGFTLIELVIVIAILGILSALALPKFVDLSSKARISSVNAARGALNSTATMAKSNYLVTSPVPATVTFEGITLTYTTGAAAGSGYPTTANLAAAAGLSATDYTITTTAANLTVSPISAPTAATCSVVYTPPAVATAAPTIVTTTTGC
jgi:MSHA pilin protein MshA